MLTDSPFVQPLEVVKTTMAANRNDGFGGAIRKIWARGGVLGCTLLCPLSSARRSCANPPFPRSLPRPDPLGLD